jgi:hypothetical protein
MPFGQSVGVRFGAKAIAASMGADPVTQMVVGQVAGWTAAVLTGDVHSQGAVEVLDHGHNAYNIGEAAHHAVMNFGQNGPCPEDVCHGFQDNVINQTGVAGHDGLCDRSYCGHPKSIHH